MKAGPDAGVARLGRQVLAGAAALDRVDIDASIRELIPVVTAHCADDDFKRICIKEAACLYLGAALLQGFGRLDEAVFWWRERKRLLDVIAHNHLGASAAAPDPDHELLFDPFWSAHIGHTAMLGIYVKKNILQGQHAKRLALVRRVGQHIGNPCLVQHWTRYFTMVDDASDLRVPPDLLGYVSKVLFLEDLLSGPETYFWESFAEITKAWEAASGGPLLALTPLELRRGRQVLADIGLPANAWYVCLHVRSAGFRSKHDGLHGVLNADIATYQPMIDAIASRGGWIIRMGDPSMPEIPRRNQVIDYAHSDLKTDRMDVFLCGTCRFFVGTSSGLGYVPGLFDTPGVFTNWAPAGTRPLNSRDLYLPKLHRYDRDGELVPFSESLPPPLGHIHADSVLRARGFSLRDNTPEELQDAAVEMLDRLDGIARYTEEDERLQAQFNGIAATSRSYGNARIARDFIRKHRRLLS